MGWSLRIAPTSPWLSSTEVVLFPSLRPHISCGVAGPHADEFAIILQLYHLGHMAFPGATERKKNPGELSLSFSLPQPEMTHITSASDFASCPLLYGHLPVRWEIWRSK